MWTATVGRKRVRARAEARIHDGRFTIKFVIPRKARKVKRASVMLRYRGDTHVRAAKRRLSVRSR